MNKIGYLLFFFLPLFVMGQKFAVIGDYRGGDTNAFKVSQLVKSWNPEFIVTTGDNFRPAQGTIDFQVGQFYHDFISPYVGSYGFGDTVNRFFPAIGNHDVEGTGLDDYQNFFTLPGNERYYDFVKENIHFFILNSDPSEPDGNTDTSIQAVWLQNALTASISKFNLVFLHHPPFTSGVHGCNLFSQWPFKQWGATAVFSGHDHDYERLFVDSLPYFICAAGGSALYCTFTNYPGTQHFYCSNFGALLIEANNDSLILKYYNINDSLIDSYSIYYFSSGVKPVYYDANSILQCFPNPYSDLTTIRYFLVSDCRATLTVYNSSGKKIKVFSDKRQNKGVYEVTWSTSGFPGGIYSIGLKAGGNNYFINTIKTESK